MKRLVIDFGSGYTKIYMPGCGVVLFEATCIAVEEMADKRSYNIKAYGDKAKALYGRAARSTHIMYPVEQGDIRYENLALQLMRYFLEKIEIPARKARHAEALFLLPCGAKDEVVRRYRHLADECGFANAYFSRVPFAIILGHNITMSESNPVFCMDIGCTVSNLAAVSQDGIISGRSVYLGGKDIDICITDDLANNHDFRIGALTAENLKNSVGSLLPDDNKMNNVYGRERSSGTPQTLSVYSGHLYGIIAGHLDTIIKQAADMLSSLSPDVSSGIMRSGIYLAGGMMKVDGVPEYIHKRLDIPVNMPEDPQLAAVIGGGTILSDDKLLDRLTEASG
ncbi:MAG: rod shape-determining protein [Clostridia bacterium]|nr:rod shape-determining protein [Clostridia bacterium]